MLEPHCHRLLCIRWPVDSTARKHNSYNLHRLKMPYSPHDTVKNMLNLKCKLISSHVSKKNYFAYSSYVFLEFLNQPLFPQTGSTSLIWHSQPKLHAAVKFTVNGSGVACVVLQLKKNLLVFSFSSSTFIDFVFGKSISVFVLILWRFSTKRKAENSTANQLPVVIGNSCSGHF